MSDTGSRRYKVLFQDLDENLAAEMDVSSNDFSSSKIVVPGGCYELRIEFVKPENLHVDSITLK